MDCLTFDIGGTKTAAAWWQGHALQLRREAPTPADAAGVLHLLEQLVRDAPPVQRVGAAVTGVTDGRRVGALNRDMIAGWDGLPLADLLEQRLGLPVVLLNDAQAAAWGEHRAQGASVQDLMFVTVSTGIGAGVVLGGQLRSGSTGLAGHLGHVAAARAAHPGAAPCSCGREACLERQASGSAMSQALAALGLGTRTARDWMAAPHRDQLAVQTWLAKATRTLAGALADAHALLDLQRVLLGGGLGLQPNFLLGVQQAMALLPARFQVPVEPARLGADAALQGMVHWLHERHATTA
jgi:N-acylmannosamine kinase